MMKIAWSGSISQKHGSADPDPPQNLMDPEHCFKDTSPLMSSLLVTCVWGGEAIFLGSKSGQKQRVKLLQNMVYSTIQHSTPPPSQSRTVHKYTSIVPSSTRATVHKLGRKYKPWLHQWMISQHSNGVVNCYLEPSACTTTVLKFFEGDPGWKIGSGMEKIWIRNTFFIIKVRLLDQVWESYRAADGAGSVRKIRIQDGQNSDPQHFFLLLK